MSEVQQTTVQEMDDLLKRMFEKKAEIEAHDEVGSKLSAELTKMKAQAVENLKQLERENYKCQWGTVTIVEKWQVSVPKTDEEKKAFFTYLREYGGPALLYKYATVNSNSLNSFFLQEWDEAKKKGEGMEYRMPGVSEPKLFESISMIKKK